MPAKMFNHTLKLYIAIHTPRGEMKIQQEARNNMMVHFDVHKLQVLILMIQKIRYE